MPALLEICRDRGRKFSPSGNLRPLRRAPGMNLLARFVPLITVLLIFALDRISKVLIRSNFFYGEAHQVAPFFSLTYIENTGAAFGLGQNQNMFFIITSIAILLILFIIVRTTF